MKSAFPTCIQKSLVLIGAAIFSVALLSSVAHAEIAKADSSTVPLAWTNLNCDEILSLRGSEPVTKPISIETLREDTAAYVQFLRTCWSNRALHEKLDGFSFESRATQLQELANRADASTTLILDALKKFTLSMHDGHLSFSDPRASRYLFSGLKVLRVTEGLAIVSCRNSDANCSQLKLPALIQSIDGLKASEWLKSKAKMMMGSTEIGRVYHAERALEADSSFPLSNLEHSKPASRLNLLDASKINTDFDLNWSDVATPWIQDAVSEPCISSKIIGTTFVLKITGFVCVGNTDYGPLMDSSLIPMMEKEFAKAGSFQRLVIDLRGNPGGLPKAAKWLVGRLTRASKTFYFRTQIQRSRFPELDEYAVRVDSKDNADADFRTKPLWLLADGGCYSQCSIIVRSFIESGRGKLIGEVDSGAGGPRYWMAPNGHWGAEIPIWRTLDQKGNPMESYSLRSSLPLRVRLQDLRTNENVKSTGDPVLAAAIETITQKR